ncbi:Plant regulator RWP-RK family protein [Rhynchospora pubera]|uniref:Plant regulator RWP-RK family protein n=1 Tax=Rhynchospora pubera TaxID=906938 RepID=A0AAV8CZK8_9POAL|nr:Plant regulator RWP-RK family protein [Rhynchospora pubera]
MDYPEENYDPDCDISRFLTFPDPPLEELMLSPSAEQLPLAAPLLLPELPQSVPHVNTPVLSALPLVLSGMNTVDPPIPNMKSEPLSVEGVIISALEQVHIEGSWSSTTAKNDDEAPYEPIFEQYLPGQRDCTCCVTLREVSHSSPNRNLIFTVHGGLGTFDHAVFDVEYFKEGGQLIKHELFYVDLSTRSHDWVKSFMVGCVTLLHTDTSGTVKDSLASFYDTLCADMNTPIEEALEIDFGPTLCFEDAEDCLIQLPHIFEIGETSRTKKDVLNHNSFKVDLPIEKEPTILIPNPTLQGPSGSTSSLAASPTVTSSDSMQLSGSSGESPFVIEDAKYASVEVPDTGRRAPARTPLALQRQRTANMRLFELANYLHLPMAEAARRLKVCSTALKHVCRRNGLARWPSRQIQAIDRQIAKFEHDMVQGSRRGGLFAIKEAIEALQKKKAAIYEKMLHDY